MNHPVQRELDRLRAQQEAEKILREERAEEAWISPLIMSGAERAAQAPSHYDYLIDPLWVRGHTALVVGQYKKGKTTLLQNVVKSLATGEALFGTFPVGDVPGSIVYLDLELTDNDLGLWIRRGGLALDNVFFASLRGSSHHLDFRTEFTRRKMRELLEPYHPISALFLDPAGAIVQTVSGDTGGENDNTFVGEFLRAFNRFLKEANIESGIVSHHTGQVKGSKRGRGAAAWMDVPDEIWAYTKFNEYRDTNDAPDDARLITVTTRGAHVPEFVVRFDEDNRRLYYDRDLTDWETTESVDQKMQRSIMNKLRQEGRGSGNAT